jgi:Fe-S cluster assembly ATPase SufC
MNIAGVKSRGTLRPAYHEKLRADLKALVLGLKIKTGKRPASKYSSDDDINKQKKISEIARSEKLSQTIAALSFKMMILEREIEGLRSGGVVKADNVANLINKRLKSGRKDNGKAR